MLNKDTTHARAEGERRAMSNAEAGRATVEFELVHPVAPNRNRAFPAWLFAGAVALVVVLGVIALLPAGR